MLDRVSLRLGEETAWSSCKMMEINTVQSIYAQCVAVVLVISRAGIGPKPEEVRANARRKKGKRYVRVFIIV